MIWIIIGILFMILLTVGHSQTKQDIQIQQTEELIQATYPPIEREARNQAKVRERSIAFMRKLIVWALVGWVIWYTFFHTPAAHAEPMPQFTTEQLCYLGGYRPSDGAIKDCVAKQQYYLNWNRAMWDNVSSTTQRTCADMIHRLDPSGFGAYQPLYDCLVQYGSRDYWKTAPTQVR